MSKVLVDSGWRVLTLDELRRTRAPASFFQTSTMTDEPARLSAVTHHSPFTGERMLTVAVSLRGPPGGDRVMKNFRSGNTPDSLYSAETGGAVSTTVSKMAHAVIAAHDLPMRSTLFTSGRFAARSS